MPTYHHARLNILHTRRYLWCERNVRNWNCPFLSIGAISAVEWRGRSVCVRDALQVLSSGHITSLCSASHWPCSELSSSSFAWLAYLNCGTALHLSGWRDVTGAKVVCWEKSEKKMKCSRDLQIHVGRVENENQMSAFWNFPLEEWHQRVHLLPFHGTVTEGTAPGGNSHFDTTNKLSFGFKASCSGN